MSDRDGSPPFAHEARSRERGNGPGDEGREDRQGGKVGVLHRIGSFFALREDEDEEYVEDEVAPQRRNVVNLAAREGRRPASAEVALFAPKAFAEVAEIADALRNRQVVILNMQGLERGLLQRVVDFTSGVAYTLEGKMQKLAEAMYLIVPPGVAVNAQGLRETLGRSTDFDFISDRG